MPTTTVKTIGSGGDYSTLPLWEADRQTASSSGDTERAEFLDGTYTGTTHNTTLAGWTAGVNIEIAAQNPHLNDWSVTDQGAKIVHNGTFINSQMPTCPVTFEDLVFQYSGSGYYAQAYFSQNGSGSTDVTVNAFRCMVRDYSGPNLCKFLCFEGAMSSTYRWKCNVDSCVILNCGTSSDTASIYPNAWGSGVNVRATVTVRKTTFSKSGIAFTRNSASSDLVLMVRGCLCDPPTSQNFLRINGTAGTITSAEAEYNVGTPTTSAFETNFTSNSNYTQANWVTGTPASGEVGFTDLTTYDYSLVDHANNVAINYVASGSMPSFDVLGLSVPQGAYADAGAFEVEVPAGTTVTPGAGSLTTATFAPSVTRTEHVWAAPAATTLTTTPATPTVTATDNKWASPAAATLTTTPATPTVTATDNKWVTPAAATLTLTTFAPSVAYDADLWVTPGAGTLTVGVFAPTVLSTFEAAPGPGLLEITTYAPTVAFTGAPTSVVTYGAPTTDVVLAAGDEWYVTMEGPAADQPFVRVTLTFNEHA